MKFCFITSFFGSYSFGGDAVYVDRLCRALLRRGHEVHVAFSRRAYQALPAGPPPRRYEPPPGLVLHELADGPAGRLSAYWAHQTGHSPWVRCSLVSLLTNHRFDVIHLHNVSLLGGRGICSWLRSWPARKVVTAHDYWWICPLSLLWKDGRAVCEKPSCFTCSLRSRRPPQLWRWGEWCLEALAPMDAVFFPSESARRIYRSRGFRHHNEIVLPGIIPEDWRSANPGPAAGPVHYFAAAGRFVPEKGFQTLIPLMSQLPEVELRIAGTGPLEDSLRKAARGLPNVRFLGMLDHDEIRQLFAGARAVLAPSLFPETFGLAVAEALSLGVPVIARRRGSLPELIHATAGGFLFEQEEELVRHMRTLAHDDGVRKKVATAIRRSLPPIWFEEEHTKTYLQILAACNSSKRSGETE